ncbi:MAG TPA: glycosyltransferase family 2 protein [Candidatus Omnitrophica bacterium]|nr:glycosyltransferase family 2 protein [Candidatus Omnitrophota bacterium]
MDADTLSVIVVNHNGKDFLKNCLDSLRIQTYKPAEIIVVDNASSDSSKELVRGEFPEVELLENERNLYFAKAMNQGIRKATGDWILCLNNDVRLDEKFLKECMKLPKEDGKIGMVCGKIYSMRWSRFLDSCGQNLSRARTGEDRGYRRRDDGRFDSGGYVFGPGGVAPLYRREMLEEVKIGDEYFDEDYEIFYEDLDIAWRAQKLGWKCFYNPRAIAYHYRSGSTLGITEPNKWPRYIFPHLKDDIKYLVVVNRYRTILKNEDLKDFFCNFFHILFHELKVWGYILIFDWRLLVKLLYELPKVKTSIKKRC